MRKLVVLLTGILCLSIAAWAQPSVTLSGKVTDSKDGTGIPGVSITVKGGKVGVKSDASGAYNITVPSGKTVLVFSFVGYQSEERAIGRLLTLDVALQSSANDLNEVVVTGYSRERKGQFVGAAAKISGDLVATVPVGAFDQALQGRIPGMVVNSGSGQPGSSATIRIRGVQSIQGAGAQPLFVIDGVPMPAFDMQTVNPSDFESITVLKDAATTAMYGARGGTGVVVITTKKGRAGVTNVQYRTQYGVTQAPNFDRLNLMNTKEMLSYEEKTKLAGTPGWNYSVNNPANANISQAAKDRNAFLLDSLGRIDSDWSDILFRQGVSKSHEFNMSAGTDKTKVYFSAGYFDQEGIDLGSSLKRFTTRFNVDHTVGKFNIAFNTTLGYSQSKFAEGEIYGNSPRNPFQMVYRAKTYENPYRADGSIIYGANTTLSLKQVGNLLEGIQNSSRDINQIKINTGLAFSYKIIPSVTVKNLTGIDVGSEYHNRYISAGSYIGSLQTFQAGLAQEASRVTANIINTSSVVFAKKFSSIHDVEVGGYFEIVKGYQRGLGFTLYNLDPRLTATGQGAGAIPVAAGQTTYPQNASSAKGEYGIRSYFASAKYTYNNKYTINANIRQDGTSRIVNSANREITTWSAGAVWNTLQENFMSKQNIFTDLKVRASYGIVPNIGSITTGSFGAGLVGVTNYQGPQLPAFGTTSYAGSTVVGLAPSTPGNDKLKIENIKKTNIGLDMAFLRNRVRLSVDVYSNRTVDLFVSQPLSGTTGFGNLNVNAGVMTNKGVEFLAGFDVVKTKDIDVSLGVNHSFNKNNIEDLGLVNEYFLGTFVIRKGLSYGSHYTYNYLGADPATGKPIFETADGKTTTDAAQAGQFAKFGNFLPKHVGGFDLNARYKGFSVQALFSYQFDVVRSNNTRNWITRGTPGYHTAVRGSRELLTNQWTKAGDVALFQDYNYDRGFTSSDLEDAKFLRFRNLTVAYQIPQIKTGSGTTIIKSARFYIQGQNLMIWSPWRGVDPEDDNNISLNEYPNPKAIVVGLDINF
ncbi:MAG: SusC/RagA family TonB-linked outer membrane protein [Bacteroidota bacterium]